MVGWEVGEWVVVVGGGGEEGTEGFYERAKELSPSPAVLSVSGFAGDRWHAHELTQRSLHLP